MSHSFIHARSTPDKPAYIMGASGETVTYRQLDERSNQGAHLFRKLGLRVGDPVAFFIDNHPRYYEILRAAQRSGLRYTCISSKLSPDEVAYIVKDCGAGVLIASCALAEVALRTAPLIEGAALFMVGGDAGPFASFEDARAGLPTTPIADETAGEAMLYSSGTTGRPKGVIRHVADPNPRIDGPNQQAELGVARYGFTPDTVYLSPAPLYHAAPLAWSMAVQTLGGTVVMMERFEAEAALALIERYRVTSAQWVPTHFIRMLKLPEAVRSRYDVSSLIAVFHAAAPCPVEVKSQMMAWWGPIIHEYYAGTERNGICGITPEEWLARPGSVGRGINAEVKVCDDAGEPAPPRTEGLVYFAGGPTFEYLGDPVKTAETRNRYGWTTLGDVGWQDEEGYLYLTDRKSFMIISGGVNIYPQEIENLLITHPKVADVAVIGAPHEEMGEQVVAVVQPAEDVQPGPALAEELSDWVRARISHVKAPRRIDFMAELPRQATGKLYKRLIRDAYWGKGEGAKA
ncbi:MAG: acyl-CoA synthetase [Caulobacteraceae bacterium]|nr:acyl-CoA synthetase [Caulobacteraceae bacterium]